MSRRETLTYDEKNNTAGVAISPKKVVHQGLWGHIKHPFLLPLHMGTLKPRYEIKGFRLTASMRFLLGTSPVNSTASLPGIPQVWWQASIC